MARKLHPGSQASHCQIQLSCKAKSSSDGRNYGSLDYLGRLAYVLLEVKRTGKPEAHCLSDVMSLIMLGSRHCQGSHEVEGQWRCKTAHQQRICEQGVGIGMARHQEVEAESAHLEESIVCSLQIVDVCLHAQA